MKNFQLVIRIPNAKSGFHTGTKSNEKLWLYGKKIVIQFHKVK